MTCAEASALGHLFNREESRYQDWLVQPRWAGAWRLGREIQTSSNKSQGANEVLEEKRDEVGVVGNSKALKLWK